MSDQQTVNDEAILDESIGTVRIVQTATKEQVLAWASACPWVSAQEDGSITISLAGTAPTIPIPIEILVGVKAMSIQTEGVFNNPIVIPPEPPEPPELTLEFPNVTYTGSWSKHIVQYGTDWYYEWMLTTNGMLNFPTELVADVTLIGGGGKGGNGAVNGSSTFIGSGGGAGTPVYAMGKSFLGNSVVSLGSSGQDSLIYINGIPTIAAKGGNGVDATTSNSASTHGTGFIGGVDKFLG